MGTPIYWNDSLIHCLMCTLPFLFPMLYIGIIPNFMHVLVLARAWGIDLRDMSFSLCVKNIVNFSKLDFSYGLIFGYMST